MTQEQLLQIILNGENISVEFKKCTTELNHTVFETVCSFLNRIGGHLILGIDNNGKIIGVNASSIESMIKNFINTVNNLEMLNPTFYFSPEVFTIDGKQIIYIYISESSQAYQRLMTFIRRNLPDKFHLEGIQRVDIRNVIFREMAANMLIHREFSHSFPAKFLIFSDRVITENWTKPFGKNPITLENLETHPKNPNIAHVFREMGWGEQLGSGRKNIMKYAPYYYDKYKITIKNEEKFVFEITYRDDMNGNAKINVVDDNANGENDDVNVHFEMSEIQSDKTHTLISSILSDNVRPFKRPLNDNVNIVDDKVNVPDDKVNTTDDNVKNRLFTIIGSLFHQPGQNRKKLIEQTKIKNPTIDRYIKILKIADVIEFVGADKTGGYYLTQKAKDALN